jgi:hypothetical protein
MNAIAGPARSPTAASAIAPLSVLSGLKSIPKAARASSAVGIGKQISVIALLGGLHIAPFYHIHKILVTSNNLVPRFSIRAKSR